METSGANSGGGVRGDGGMRTFRWFLIPPRVGPAVWVPPAMCGLGFAGALAVGAVTAAGVADVFHDWEGLARTSVIALVAGVAQLAWLIAVLYAAKRMMPRTIPPAAPARLGESFALLAVSTLLTWPVLWFVGTIAGNLEQQWSGLEPTAGHETLLQLSEAPQHDLWWWVMVLHASLLAPIAEELLYRGVVQQGMKSASFSRPLAVVCTAVVFALLHWDMLPDGTRYSGLLTLTLLGVYWGWLYERTGRLTICAAAHAMFNVANLLLLQAGPAPSL